MRKQGDYGVRWNTPKLRSTPFGQRMVRQGKVTEEFLDAWRHEFHSLTAEGYALLMIRGERYVRQSARLNTQKERHQSVVDSLATASDIDVPIPKGLELFDYQKAAVKFIIPRTESLIADQMGVGKTIETIAALNAMPKSKVRTILLVVPASLKLNWKMELEKWLTHKLPIYVIERHWAEYVQGKWLPLSKRRAGIYIVGYSSLHKFEKNLDRKWHVIIADEVHYIKNNYTRRARALRAVPAERKIALSGTPLTARPRDLFSVLNWLNPSEWPDYLAYGKRYCQGEAEFKGASNLEELQERLRSSFMIRRLKKDVLKQLPRKTRQTIVMQATFKEEKIALREEQDVMDDLEALIAGETLRCNVRLLFSRISILRHRTALAKLPKVVEHIFDALEGEEHLVVFTHHRDVLQGIQDELDLNDISNVVVTGSNSQKERHDAVWNFQNGLSRVFLGTMGSAGVGLTLTQASTVIFAELDWTPATLSQAEDRLHRIGTKKNVLVQHCVLNGSIDARIAQVVIAKQKNFDKALDDPIDMAGIQ